MSGLFVSWKSGERCDLGTPPFCSHPALAKEPDRRCEVRESSAAASESVVSESDS